MKHEDLPLKEQLKNVVNFLADNADDAHKEESDEKRKSCLEMLKDWPDNGPEPKQAQE